MTNTTGDSEPLLLKTDVLGRVRTPAARREQLLDEFERSGTSGAKFAQLVGVKSQTFASWVQQRRRQRKAAAKSQVTKSSASTVRWLEAVVARTTNPIDGGDATLPVHLPGGVRLEISCATQIPLAAALVRALEKSPASC